MTITSSPHHHFVLCLFLLSFLSVNSQSSYVVILRNESPNNVATDQCYVNDDIDHPGEEILLNPGIESIVIFFVSINHKSTMADLIKLDMICFDVIRGLNYADLVTLFDSNDTSICHIPNEEYLWKIHEDGLCMCSEELLEVKKTADPPS
ncbi:hypothetical protein H5410_048349 [Solanum commersonii]|uniref:Uncharacterized protein n=1 Tax=Solanum commersonii TaxID=4109 RepID=A0A9J5XHX1_SOLCO|nr:hypothetical protein H5410_048349 [Solanum commersonii]